MSDVKTTILIPDISGFTEFMTTTELSHASKAINWLIDAILEAVGEEYEVSEIEGDAVLLIRKGPAPSRKEIIDTCMRIFNAFHFKRKWMEQYTVCPCGACQAIINLSLKFVAHHGPLAEMKVGKFIKQSGTEMIVAHRLLKNSIGNNEYLLLTDKLLQHTEDLSKDSNVAWVTSSEEYASLGKIDYRYTLLNEARKNVPLPQEPDTRYQTDDTSFIQVTIHAPYMEVYMRVMNIPGRPHWQPGLDKVEQEMDSVFIGSLHYCSFNDYEAIISPLKMTLSDDGIIYAESCCIDKLHISLVHEFVFKKTDEMNSIFATRFLNRGDVPLPEDIRSSLHSRMQEMADKLKDISEYHGSN